MNKFLLWAVVALMTTLNAQAQEENNKGDRPRETYLTEATRPRGSHILPAPPSFTGEEFANDLYYYQWGKTQRQDQHLREELIHADTTGIFKLFSEAMGIKMSRKMTPEIYKLARKALDDAHEAVDVAQKHFKRTKPFVKFHEESLKPEGYIHNFKDKGDSYPSGHATRGWMNELRTPVCFEPRHHGPPLEERHRCRADACCRLICRHFSVRSLSKTAYQGQSRV